MSVALMLVWRDEVRAHASRQRERKEEEAVAETLQGDVFIAYLVQKKES